MVMEVNQALKTRVAIRIAENKKIYIDVKFGIEIK